MSAQRVINDISASEAEAIVVPWMHCRDVIEGNFDVNLGRGRQLRRGGFWGRRRLVPSSLDQLCQLTNMAHAALEADEHKSSLHGSLDSMESLRDSACSLGTSQPTPCEPSVDTPPALCPIPQHHEPGRGYAGWKEFSGRSRAPSPWPSESRRDQPAKSRRCSPLRASDQGLLQGVQSGKGDFATWVGRTRSSLFDLGESESGIGDMGLGMNP